MVRTSVTIQEVVDLLNEAVQADGEAMRALVELRVPCNQALADHPTIQVGAFDGVMKVGMLGVLNGIFGCDDKGGFVGAVLTLVCESCGPDENDPRLKDHEFGTPCPVCGGKLVTGKLEKFVVIRPPEVE